MDRDYFNTEFNKALRNGNAEEANKLIEEFVEWLFENKDELKMFKQKCEEIIKQCEEEKRENEVLMMDFRQQNIEKASASINFLFPIGEA